MSHVRGRYIPVVEQEMRRAVKEPVAVWRQEWVHPSSTSSSSSAAFAADAAAASGSTKNDGALKILKWVKTNATAEFPEEEDSEYAGGADLDPLPVPLAGVATGSGMGTGTGGTSTPVVVSSTLSGGAAGGLGSIAPPRDPAGKSVASALPSHLSNATAPANGGESGVATPSTMQASTSIDSLNPSASLSRADTPQANPQVATELHPPPSGLPRDTDADVDAETTSGKEKEKEEDDSTLPPPSSRVEDIENRDSLTIQPSAEQRQIRELTPGNEKQDIDVVGVEDREVEGDVTMGDE